MQRVADVHVLVVAAGPAKRACPARSSTPARSMPRRAQLVEHRRAGKSAPTTPTMRTGVKKLAASEKYSAAPPRTSSARPPRRLDRIDARPTPDSRARLDADASPMRTCRSSGRQLRSRAARAPGMRRAIGDDGVLQRAWRRRRCARRQALGDAGDGAPRQLGVGGEDAQHVLDHDVRRRRTSSSRSRSPAPGWRSRSPPRAPAWPPASWSCR